MWTPTVFDLKTLPCGCDHEKIGRDKHATASDVITAVKNCCFAANGLMINCAHGNKSGAFFQHDGRGILYTAMKQRGMSVRQLNSFYAVKWYLDVLKRRACGRYFSMDPTVIQMMKSATLRPLLDPYHPLREILLRIFHYANNPPTDDEGIRTCDLFFLNADKFISDGISQILTRVQSIDTVPMN